MAQFLVGAVSESFLHTMTTYLKLILLCKASFLQVIPKSWFGQKEVAWHSQKHISFILALPFLDMLF